VPSPAYPVLHAQATPVAVLVQVAFALHGLGVAAHVTPDPVPPWPPWPAEPPTASPPEPPLALPAEPPVALPAEPPVALPAAPP
jgi:hypothetical protein